MGGGWRLARDGAGIFGWVTADEGVLLKIDDLAADRAAFWGEPVGGCGSDFVGPEDTACGCVNLWQIGIPIVFEAVVAFALGFVFGKDPAGIDLIDADSVLPHEGIAKVTSEGHEGTFGDRVGHQIGFSAPGIDAADVEDAALGLTEFWEGGLDEGEGGDGVYLQHTPEESEISGVKIGRSDECGVVDDGVEVAKATDGELDEVLRAAFLSEILDVRDGVLAAEIGDGSGG